MESLDEKVTQIALSLSYFCNSYKATDLPRRQEKGAEIPPSTPTRKLKSLTDSHTLWQLPMEVPCHRIRSGDWNL